MNIKYNLSLLSLYNLCFTYTNILELESKYNFIKDSLDLKLMDFKDSLDLLITKGILICKKEENPILNTILIKQRYKYLLCRYKAAWDVCKYESNCNYIHHIYELKFICYYKNFIDKDMNFINFNNYLLNSFNETIYNKCEKKDNIYQLFIDNNIFHCIFYDKDFKFNNEEKELEKKIADNLENNKKKELGKKIADHLKNFRKKEFHNNIKKEYSSDEFSDKNDNSDYESNYYESKNLHNRYKRKREKPNSNTYELDFNKLKSNKRKKIQKQILENDLREVNNKIKKEEKRIKEERRKEKEEKRLRELLKKNLIKFKKKCSSCNKIKTNYSLYCDSCQKINIFKNEYDRDINNKIKEKEN